MTHLKEGMKAPPFSGKDKNGTTVSLENFKGKKIVLYFYPKDNTAGCTAEACSLNSYYGDFVKKDYAVVGVSPDSEASHQRFAAKYELKFNLLSDVNHEIAIAYGVWGEKKMYGKTYMGIIRTTFIIDENGVIEKIIDKVDTQNHAAQILN
ncbi:MAG: thioredoxin-dependent thiol peroxidase [Cytophagaceae bacterium]|jgi:peroxiredoxin Q/BCP|nr:thioredoxin-dependent thiol peroxidase [Cytophagaceae bacterium]